MHPGPPPPAGQIDSGAAAALSPRYCRGAPKEPAMANKIYPDAAAALAGLLHDGMMIMAGGFGLCGIPEKLILAIRDSVVRGLTVASNNAGIAAARLGLLVQTPQIKTTLS